MTLRLPTEKSSSAKIRTGSGRMKFPSTTTLSGMRPPGGDPRTSYVVTASARARGENGGRLLIVEMPTLKVLGVAKAVADEELPSVVLTKLDELSATPSLKIGVCPLPSTGCVLKATAVPKPRESAIAKGAIAVNKTRYAIVR